MLGGFGGHVGRHIDGFDGVHEGYGVGERNLEGRMLPEFCLVFCIKYMVLREEERKVTLSMGEIETKIDFVLIKKNTSDFY